MTIGELRGRLSESSAQQLTRQLMGALMTAESGPHKLNAFISFDFDLAVSAAAAADAAVASGRLLPLAGIPVAVKDNLCTTEYATTCASRILANFRAPYDATVVKRLRDAGAIIVGKTNLDEFAMGSSTESSAFGRTRNPHDGKRVPGGSSGGSAAVVAAGLVPVALGSDTAGSVRQPAAFCGAVGFKPTYGRISRYGLIAYASSLDTVGILANRVADVAEVLGVIAGVDPFDATSQDMPLQPVTLDGDLRGTVIGIPNEYFPPMLQSGVREKCERAIELMRDAGAEIRAVELPHTRLGIPAYYALSTIEACSNLARYDGVRYGVRARDAVTIRELYDRTRAIGFGTEVKRRILLGLHMLSEQPRTTLARARRASQLIREDFDRAFASGIDLLFTPTTSTTAFESSEKTDPYELYLSDMLTVAANLAGIPAISIPIGKSGGLPVGGQLLAPKWAEAGMLRGAAALEALV